MTTTTITNAKVVIKTFEFNFSLDKIPACKKKKSNIKPAPIKMRND